MRNERLAFYLNALSRANEQGRVANFNVDVECSLGYYTTRMTIVVKEQQAKKEVFRPLQSFQQVIEDVVFQATVQSWNRSMWS